MRFVIAFLSAGLAAALSAAAQPAGQAPAPWGRCCGMTPWSQPPGTTAPGMMGPHGHGMMRQMQPGMARRHAAMMSGVPAPYTNLSNPLPRTGATLELGRRLYESNCASCHGETGLGDGPAGRDLKPPPGNLAWLSSMPISNWDPYMYWTVAEGGAPFGTAMPSFKSTLSDQEIWAVVAYIQARLPERPAPK